MCPHRKVWALKDDVLTPVQTNQEAACSGTQGLGTPETLSEVCYSPKEGSLIIM